MRETVNLVKLMGPFIKALEEVARADETFGVTQPFDEKAAGEYQKFSWSLKQHPKVLDQILDELFIITKDKRRPANVRAVAALFCANLFLEGKTPEQVKERMPQQVEAEEIWRARLLDFMRDRPCFGYALFNASSDRWSQVLKDCSLDLKRLEEEMLDTYEEVLEFYKLEKPLKVFDTSIETLLCHRVQTGILSQPDVFALIVTPAKLAIARSEDEKVIRHIVYGIAAVGMMLTLTQFERKGLAGCLSLALTKLHRRGFGDEAEEMALAVVRGPMTVKGCHIKWYAKMFLEDGPLPEKPAINRVQTGIPLAVPKAMAGG